MSPDSSRPHRVQLFVDAVADRAMEYMTARPNEHVHVSEVTAYVRRDIPQANFVIVELVMDMVAGVFDVADWTDVPAASPPAVP